MMSTILDIASRHTQLGQRGKEWFGLCPFHQEKTSSFAVNPDKEVFHCFGCGKSGDAITLLRELEGKTFREAAAIVGKELDSLPSRQVKQRAKVLKQEYEEWWEKRFILLRETLAHAKRELEIAEIAERYHRYHPGEWDEATVGYWGVLYAFWEAEWYHLQYEYYLWIDPKWELKRIRQWRGDGA